jgi:predicted MPP superfamily phosphohydrolase
VSVVRDLESDFYILHLTDEHVREESARESKEPARGFRTAELVRWAAPVVNLLNPRFVVNSGDLTYQYHSDGKPAHSANLITRYADAKAAYRVASISVPGNHDVPRSESPSHAEGAARWEATLGPRAFALRLGSLHVLAHDFHDRDLREWAAAEYAATADDPSIRGRLIVQHFVDYLERKGNDAHAFRPTPRMPRPTLMLIGHAHMTRVDQAEPFPVLMTVAAHRHARAGFVAFTRDAAGDWIAPGAATWSAGSAFPLVADHGRPMAAVSFSPANDGAASASTATIRNDLPQRFPDGRVRFLLTPGRYAVRGGTKLSEYDYTESSGASRTAVLVAVDLPARAEVVVTITPVR